MVIEGTRRVIATMPRVTASVIRQSRDGYFKGHSHSCDDKGEVSEKSIGWLTIILTEAVSVRDYHEIVVMIIGSIEGSVIGD